MSSIRIDSQLKSAAMCAGARDGGQSVAEWVTDQLRQTIAGGEFAPGDRLPGERQLSESLNVSRVSIRAALQKLKAQGLLSSVQGGGTRVVARAPQMDSPLTGLVLSSAENLNDLVSMRASMVAWAARCAVERFGENDLKMLDEVRQRLLAAQRVTEIAALDMKFHALLSRASGSAVFLHLAAVLDNVLSSALVEMELSVSAKSTDSALLKSLAQSCFAALKARDVDALVRAVEHRERHRLAQLDRAILGTALPDVEWPQAAE